MTRYYDCECTCSILRTEVIEDKETCIAIYRQCNYFPILHRLKQAFHVLRYGEPYGDTLVLGEKSAKRLANDLLKDLK